MRQVRREIIHTNALTWLQENERTLSGYVVTSLPDISELASTVRQDVPVYKQWLRDATRLILQALDPHDSIAIFYQSDIMAKDGVWIDKAYQIQRMAEDMGWVLLFHKVALISPPDTLKIGRSAYTHMIALAPRPLPFKEGRPEWFPDVLSERGEMSWKKAMGERAAYECLRYLFLMKRHAWPSEKPFTIYDPFCGQGTVLAVAAEFGLDAIGVDLALRRCQAALSVTTATIPPSQRLKLNLGLPESLQITVVLSAIFNGAPPNTLATQTLFLPSSSSSSSQRNDPSVVADGEDDDVGTHPKAEP